MFVFFWGVVKCSCVFVVISGLTLYGSGLLVRVVRCVLVCCVMCVGCLWSNV